MQPALFLISVFIFIPAQAVNVKYNHPENWDIEEMQSVLSRS